MRYVKSRLESEYREATYRTYVTRSLQLAPQQQWLAVDYVDVLKPAKIDTRSGTEIARDTILNAGLQFE